MDCVGCFVKVEAVIVVCALSRSSLHFSLNRLLTLPLLITSATALQSSKTAAFVGRTTLVLENNGTLRSGAPREAGSVAHKTPYKPPAKLEDHLHAVDSTSSNPHSTDADVSSHLRRSAAKQKKNRPRYHRLTTTLVQV
ncbi:uncharacterized [Tachysurus ichikawai]